MEKKKNEKERLAYLFQRRTALQGALKAARASAHAISAISITRRCYEGIGYSEEDKEIHTFEVDGLWAERLDRLITEELRRALRKLEEEIEKMITKDESIM